MGVRVRQKIKGKGQPWWVFITHNGKRTSRKVGDKKAAEEVAITIRAKLQLGGFNFEEPKKAPTFKEHAKLWLSLPHDWKESTRENYKDNIKNHVFPVFGNVPIDKIKRKDLKAFFDRLLIKGVAPNTVSLIRSPISGVLAHAVDSELIENNPIVGMKLLKKRKSAEIIPLSKDEVGLLLGAVKQYQDGLYYPTILCALRTGMRIGEIAGLKWKDLDFENRLIEVRRSCRRRRVTPTKTGRSRFVDMTPQLAGVLSELQTSQKVNALKRGQPLQDWVFANKNGGTLRYMTLRAVLTACLKLAGLRNIRIHDLRHTYATTRLLSGHNIGDVSYQLGHSSIKITYDTYGHWLPGEFKSEVDELDNLHPSAPYMHPKPESSKNVVLFQG
jgi:integrase